MLKKHKFSDLRKKGFRKRKFIYTLHYENSESQIFSRAATVFSKARKEALQKGLSIIEARGGVLYRIEPNGKKTKIKNLEPSFKVKAGTKITL